MSQASKAKRNAGRARKDAREEKQAKNVVNSIFAVLIALAVIIAGILMYQMS